MIDPQRLAFDIDGVIANTMQLFIDIARDIHGIDHLRYEDITEYHLDRCLDIAPAVIGDIVDRIIDGNYPCRLDPIKGAKGALQRLGRQGPVRMVTARPKLGPIGEWMAEILPSAEYQVEITATGSFEAKADVLLADDVAFFVEDRLDTCFLLQQQGITPVVFVQPWNRKPHPFEEVKGWAQLEMLFDRP